MQLSPDFWRGIWTATGVLVAMYAFGVVTGVLRRVV